MDYSPNSGRITGEAPWTGQKLPGYSRSSTGSRISAEITHRYSLHRTLLFYVEPDGSLPVAKNVPSASTIEAGDLE